MNGMHKIDGAGGVIATYRKGQMNEADGNMRVHVDREYIKALKRRYYRTIIFEPAILVAGVVCMAGWTIWRWSGYRVHFGQ